jgi:hypothetical protein
MTPELARRLWPELDVLALDMNGCLLAVALEVRDIGATQRFFESRDIEYGLTGTLAIRIFPADSCGVPLEFIERAK